MNSSDGASFDAKMLPCTAA